MKPNFAALTFVSGLVVAIGGGTALAGPCSDQIAALGKKLADNTSAWNSRLMRDSQSGRDVS